jgi:hypothetical protein
VWKKTEPRKEGEAMMLVGTWMKKIERTMPATTLVRVVAMMMIHAGNHDHHHHHHQCLQQAVLSLQRRYLDLANIPRVVNNRLTGLPSQPVSVCRHFFDGSRL